MKKMFTLFCVAVLVCGLAGCGAFGGWGPIGHGSTVELSSNNFTVLKSNITGSATVTVLFPMNVPIIGAIGLPLGNADLYNLAMDDLTKKLPEKDNVGLVNLTVDDKLKHFMIIGWKTVTITADAVKFK